MPVELVAELVVLLGGVLMVLGMLLCECEGDVELLDPGLNIPVLVRRRMKER